MRTRQIRLVVALVVASLLATVLVYTALAGKTRVLQVGEMLSNPAEAKASVRLNGEVVSHAGNASAAGGMRFVLADNVRRARKVTVVYHGSVPDAFQNGRSVLVDGSYRGGVFVAKPDSLSTKCPSKYQQAPPAQASGSS